MPTPTGDITSTETWTEEVVPEVVEEVAPVEEESEDDLPELS